MAARQGIKKEKVSRGDMRRREKRIADLEKDLKMERQKYGERISQLERDNEQLRVKDAINSRMIKCIMKSRKVIVRFNQFLFLYGVLNNF